MKRLLLPLVLGTLLFNGAARAGDHLWARGLPDYSQGYDEQRDPAKDLAAATIRAQQEDKQVLLLVGGEWCSWCQEMNRFLDREPELAHQFNRTFVVVKVNVSKENKNAPFLKAYPEYLGVPHFYVLDARGKLLESFNTGLLEKGKSYDEVKFGKFIRYFERQDARS
ncbi:MULTISPECIES: thioredoxin family protein [Aeromonas]|uniref:thioredoxin family protein n=1 Tax=Aeromonas TaxID=642 RepID=UPI0022E1EF3A|nr:MULTISPECIES: thioredoxin family protein [Aeromonas]WED82944.1 thioredoxin family protein [Aeromonas media]